MPLTQIPTLPGSYPLFDWSNFQASRDALIPGTPTIHFAKAAWNDMVDRLADALAESGLEWDEAYTTAEGARMTALDGQLTAAKFNSVRLNIDHPVPLGWVWAIRQDFRGYLGRVDVHGVAEYGKDSDIVKPEFIIELARKLNLLLEIMRDTGPTVGIVSKNQLNTITELELRSQPSVQVQSEQVSSTAIQPGVVSRPGAPVIYTAYTRTTQIVDADTAPGLRMRCELETSSQQLVDGQSSRSARISARHSGLTQSTVSGGKAPAASVSSSHRSKTGTSVEMVALAGIAPADARSSSTTATSASGDVSLAVPVTPEPVTGVSTTEAEIAQSLAVPMRGSVLIDSIAVSNAATSPAVSMQVALEAASDTSMSIGVVPPEMLAPAAADSAMQSVSSATMGSGLAVAAQADTVTSTSVTATGVTAPGLATGSQHQSISAHDVELSACPSEPICATSLTDTIADASLSFLIAASAEAKTSVASLMSCTLDTAWHPPKWINGGLWIRQSHSVVRNEKGELVIV